MVRAAVPLLTAILLSACGSAGGDDTGAPAPFRDPIEASLIAGDAKSVGKVTLSEDPTGVTVKLDITDLGLGRHGLHLHEFGECSVPEFKSAGEHLNPDNRQHGRDNPQGSHLGDLANLNVAETGTAHTQFLIGGIRIAQLIDGDGVSVVVHADPDDYRTDPSGNSGARIACAAFN